ncbi:gluconate 2-dehydrogenase subunit 3 family protein [Streptosporangiaceae bacterium NEAU-GS5]|nr:gluconate 2-dehydrogenase subunit 3 family protein [Streptosporangiaceae bacterium NEAU-GS5]
MKIQLADRDDQYVLNHCTKYLARDPDDLGHVEICEAWRFPIVDSHWNRVSVETSYPFNDVTFVYASRGESPQLVSVVGTFAPLHAPVPLRPVMFAAEPTGLFAVTVRIPKGEIHVYKYVVDGRHVIDPVNPQTRVLDNGVTWSLFFTDACYTPLSLNRFERELLGRLVAHLLPFRLAENQRFVRNLYENLDRARRTAEFPLAYQLDEEIGVVNYIDKLIAREERHNADDYHTCLKIIGDLMRGRGQDPLTAPSDRYAELYAQMETEHVDGWDYARYDNPRYFLLLLRRHAMTGAFVHPRRGGNSGAAGWAYLEERFRDGNGQTLFDWRRAVEAPLGHNIDYRG